MCLVDLFFPIEAKSQTENRGFKMSGNLTDIMLV